MNPYKRWLKQLLLAFLGVFLLIGAPIIAFNYIMDPLWIFDHNNKWNDIQQGFNERQQKVNRFTFSKSDADALLVGSSRTTYINEHHFKNVKVFNMAMSSLLVDEYEGYIDYAEKLHGKPFTYIFLGVDFFAADKYRELSNQMPSTYINETNSYLYRLKTLASFDTIKKSWLVYQSSERNKPVFIDHRYYDSKNVAYPFPVSLNTVNKRIETNLYTSYKENKPFQYDPNVIKMLKKLKDEHPHTRFIVFTTPVTQPRLVTELSQKSYWNGYQQWLQDLTKTFGKVYNFMDINKITVNNENFSDSHHIVPKIGNLIVDRIWNNRKNQDPSADFGAIITKENVSKEIQKVQHEMAVHMNTTYNYLKPVNQAPIFSQTFSEEKRMMGTWQQLALEPAQILGIRGTFDYTGDLGGLKISPKSLEKGQTIQVGYDPNKIAKVDASRNMTFVVKLKGQISKHGSVQLFIQDEKNGAWDRKTFNTLVSGQQSRAFKVSKEIRPGSSRVLIGVKWSTIASKDEWVTIESADIY